MHLKYVKKINHFGILHGKIGPYFVNGHFLYGNKEDAESLLEFIDSELSNSKKEEIPEHIFSKVSNQYKTNEIYSIIIKNLIKYIKQNINIDEIDYISGGERRDWFFSNIIAHLLKKPHITIFKDLSCMLSNYNFTKTESIANLNKGKVLHVADLLNQASSYLRAWIPAIKNLNGTIKWSLSCIDRNQGGKEKLEKENINSYSLINIDLNLFNQALDLNIINNNQLSMLLEYTSDPDATMRKFLIQHPEFLDLSLNGDAKTAKRAKMCIDNNIYNL